MPAIQIPTKIQPVVRDPAKINVLIGGRGSAKSESIGRATLMACQVEGADILCGREFQNSIDDSVHKLIKNLIDKLDVKGFRVLDKKIDCVTGGGFRFRGFARNSDAVKSAQDFKVCWIEEAQNLSQKSIDDLLPTIRAGGSRFYFTANPQSSGDPFSKRFIVPFKKELEKNGGYYRDEMHQIVVCNWRDNPWHGELEMQRQWDYENLSRAKYDHIWEGAFNDSVEDAIIPAEWFDAAVDAHIKLGFKPTGPKLISHDPSDLGTDDKGLCCRHGSVVLEAATRSFGDVNEGCDWALDYAINNQADFFTWDEDGMGISLKRQIGQALKGKKMDHEGFRGSHSGSRLWRPGDVYEEVVGEKRQRVNKDLFKTKRSQFYWYLRDRFFRTFLAVNKGDYIDPDTLISISSSIEAIQQLRSEVCRIPRKFNGQGKIQIATKDEMRKMGIDSPNIADSLMMSLFVPDLMNEDEPLDFDSYY